MTYTLVAFHAHPDDETLLTGGTLARAAAEGHRVVLVVATLGEAGLASDEPGVRLGERRHRELLAAAKALGCARVETLGYRDSGLRGDHGWSDRSAPRLVDVTVARAAGQLADILREENADVLTSYDARGGYGHPDHIQVHHIGAAAARLARTPVLLEATIDRRCLRPALRILKLAGRWLPGLPLDTTPFTDRAELTHTVNVRPYLRHKRLALRAHTSQTESGSGLRTIGLLNRLPDTAFAIVAGREWFVEIGRRPNATPCDDIFTSLR
jgi:LmbE family N-acetylglucosaminyl deacetylase